MSIHLRSGIQITIETDVRNSLHTFVIYILHRLIRIFVENWLMTVALYPLFRLTKGKIKIKIFS